MKVAIFYSAVVHIAPIIFLITSVLLIGSSRINERKFNGTFTVGFSSFAAVFSLLGVFSGIVIHEHWAYTASYSVFALATAYVAIKVYYQLPNRVAQKSGAAAQSNSSIGRTSAEFTHSPGDKVQAGY